ncbi:MAG: TetR/AcrR family transcriptional regulator [Vulcanimicrobiaceae bacterium]
MRKARGRYHHGDLRGALVAAALGALERSGTADFTLRELARRCGVSHAAPYAHFPDKAALLAEVARVGFERFAAALAAAAATKDPRARLFEAGRAYVRFATAHPALYRLMFGRERAGAAVDAGLTAAAEAAFAILLGILRDLPYRGAARAPERVRGDAFAAWGLTHGLALLALDGLIAAGSVRERSRLIDAAVADLVDGVAPLAS